MAVAAPARQSENLAFIFQEILTATVRIRADRQAVSDAESFRNHIREAIQIADQQGRKAGYAPEDIRIALFAAIAFLDESILNSKNRVFADWPRRPLQEELFGGHVAGEMFFKNIERLLATNDSEILADVLEVYQLCLLLGYGGRFSVSGKGEIYSIREQIAEKIRRIRGEVGALSPDWAIPESDVLLRRKDPWMAIWMWAAIASLVLLVALFVFYRISLDRGAARLETAASQSTP